MLKDVIVINMLNIHVNNKLKHADSVYFMLEHKKHDIGILYASNNTYPNKRLNYFTHLIEKICIAIESSG